MLSSDHNASQNLGGEKKIRRRHIFKLGRRKVFIIIFLSSIVCLKEKIERGGLFQKSKTFMDKIQAKEAQGFT